MHPPAGPTTIPHIEQVHITQKVSTALSPWLHAPPCWPHDHSSHRTSTYNTEGEYSSITLPSCTPPPCWPHDHSSHRTSTYNTEGEYSSINVSTNNTQTSHHMWPHLSANFIASYEPLNYTALTNFLKLSFHQETIAKTLFFQMVAVYMWNTLLKWTYFGVL